MKLQIRGPVARAILIAFLIISIVPIVVVSGALISQSRGVLTEQMEDNVQTLVESKADEINQRLNEVLHTTLIAAAHTKSALQQEVTADQLTTGMQRYQLDGRNLLGLDVYFNAAGGAEVLGSDLSNVYWNNDIPINDVVERQIIQTEPLDAIYGSIKGVSPDTQWIYMTTPEGMMRLYPWADNDHYPDKWDPREIIFYTVADRPNNPTLEPRWTAPYVDFAGAGWMVTLSIPMVENGELLGIMSHDITINALQNLVQDIRVLDGAGYGFLIDANGNVVSHPDFQDDEALKGSQEDASLLTYGTPDFQAIITKMVNGETGSGRFVDDVDDQILVYAPIPTIGWSLGIVVPHSEVIAPARIMQQRSYTIAGVIALAAIALSLLLTHTLHQPIRQLLTGVRQMSEDSRADKLNLVSFREFEKLAQAFNEMADRVYQRERRLKEKVDALSIQIDTERKEAQIRQLVETDYFQHLENNAQLLRERIKGKAVSQPLPAVENKVFGEID